jgi:hypothetical protein
MIPHGINTPRNIGVLSLALGLFMIVTVVVLVVFDWVEDGGVIDLVGVTKTVEVDWIVGREGVLRPVGEAGAEVSVSTSMLVVNVVSVSLLVGVVVGSVVVVGMVIVVCIVIMGIVAGPKIVVVPDGGPRTVAVVKVMIRGPFVMVVPATMNVPAAMVMSVVGSPVVAAALLRAVHRIKNSKRDNRISAVSQS